MIKESIVKNWGRRDLGLMMPNKDIIWGSSPKNCKKILQIQIIWESEYLTGMKKIKTILNFKKMNYHKYFPTWHK